MFIFVYYNPGDDKTKPSMAEDFENSLPKLFWLNRSTTKKTSGTNLHDLLHIDVTITILMNQQVEQLFHFILRICRS